MAQMKSDLSCIDWIKIKAKEPGYRLDVRIGIDFIKGQEIYHKHGNRKNTVFLSNLIE